jgi:hypothetical protein
MKLLQKSSVCLRVCKHVYALPTTLQISDRLDLGMAEVFTARKEVNETPLTHGRDPVLF